MLTEAENEFLKDNPEAMRIMHKVLLAHIVNFEKDLLTTPADPVLLLAAKHRLEGAKRLCDRIKGK
jgi:hypothetical protein